MTCDVLFLVNVLCSLKSPEEVVCSVLDSHLVLRELCKRLKMEAGMQLTQGILISCLGKLKDEDRDRKFDSRLYHGSDDCGLRYAIPINRDSVWPTEPMTVGFSLHRRRTSGK